jgi:hypothetical protein
MQEIAGRAYFVKLLAFGGPGEVRRVVVPADELERAATDEEVCGLVYHYGQNDFQYAKHPSVSKGDVIRLDGRHWMVDSCGFSPIAADDLAAYSRLPRRDRQFSIYVK